MVAKGIKQLSLKDSFLIEIFCSNLQLPFKLGRMTKRKTMSLPSPVYGLPEQRIWLLLPNCIRWVVGYILFFFFFLNLLLIYIGVSFNGMSKWTLVKNHRRKKKQNEKI